MRTIQRTSLLLPFFLLICCQMVVISFGQSVDDEEMLDKVSIIRKASTNSSLHGTNSTLLNLSKCLRNGTLTNGWAIEKGRCTWRPSTFLYDIQQSAISSNGLQLGAPTDIFILLKNQTRNPRRRGLQIPGNGGKLILEFSPQFIYNQGDKTNPVPNETVDLAIGPQNYLVGNPCPYSGKQASLVCADWTARFGNSKQEIVIEPQQSAGLTGDRATQVGLKVVHIHPKLGTSSGLYFNANGTCFVAGQDYTAPVTYCRFSSDCPVQGSICQPVVRGHKGTITATLVDGSGNILFMQSKTVTFRIRPIYSVSPTNYGLADDQEVAELVDYQETTYLTTCDVLQKKNGALFSSGSPCYAPRFLLFAPQTADKAFPHPAPESIGFSIDGGGTTGKIMNNGQVIGTMELIQPDKWGDGMLVVPRSTMTENPPRNVGGSLIGIPVQVGSVPGLYTVRVTMNTFGTTSVAESTIVVTDGVPSTPPSSMPSPSYTSKPSRSPIGVASRSPTVEPTISLSRSPSHGPSVKVSALPSASPSRRPQASPTSKPTIKVIDTAPPTRPPSPMPSTRPASPSMVPSLSSNHAAPSMSPISAGVLPSAAPMVLSAASRPPTVNPTTHPVSIPNVDPSHSPTKGQSSEGPTKHTTTKPSDMPSLRPSDVPSTVPSSMPSRSPVIQPNSTVMLRSEATTNSSGNPAVSAPLIIGLVGIFIAMGVLVLTAGVLMANNAHL